MINYHVLHVQLMNTQMQQEFVLNVHPIQTLADAANAHLQDQLLLTPSTVTNAKEHSISSTTQLDRKHPVVVTLSNIFLEQAQVKNAEHATVLLKTVTHVVETHQIILSVLSVRPLTSFNKMALVH